MKKDALEFTLYTVEHRNNCVQVIDKYQHYAHELADAMMKERVILS